MLNKVTWLSGGALLALLGVAGCQNSAAATAPVESQRSPAKEAPRCGDKGLPDCPLQRWMKGTMQTYQRAGDHARLAGAFRELAEHAPSGFESWKSQAERGAQLALDKNDDGVKQICKDCHNEHRSRYRKELRGAPLW
jgi:hypothetical protein